MNIAQIAQRRYTTKAFDSSRRIPAATMSAIRTLLRNTPSSVNSQPWHFVVAESEAGKARVAKAMQGGYAYNEPKVLNASHVIVLCARQALDDAHLTAVIEQEQQDGRFASVEAKAGQDKSRRFYVDLHQQERGDAREWMDKQIYIALGALMLGAGALEVDACPMEGFDAAILDAELGLAEQGLRSVVVIALGYRSDADFNARLPKSRLPEASVFTNL